MEIAEREPQRRVRLLRNRDYLVYGLQELGLETLGSGTPIVPIIVGDDDAAVAISDELFVAGSSRPACAGPLSREGQSRIRLTLMASHEREHLDRLLEEFAAVGARYGVV